MRFLLLATVAIPALAQNCAGSLSEDYFDDKKVTDEAVKKWKAVLTVVDGKVLHNELR